MLDEADSEHLEQTPTILLEDWLREQQQTDGDELCGEGTGGEEHLGETMDLKVWLSIEEGVVRCGGDGGNGGCGGDGGPAQRSVGGTRLENKRGINAVQTSAPGEVPIGSGVSLLCSPIPGTLNSRFEDGDGGSGCGSVGGHDGWDEGWDEGRWPEDGDTDGPAPQMTKPSTVSFFLTSLGMAHRSLNGDVEVGADCGDAEVGADGGDAGRTAGAETDTEVRQLKKDLAEAKERIELLTVMCDSSLDSDGYRELWAAWRYEAVRVHWLREVLRWRFPVHSPRQGLGNWSCNLCATEHGPSKRACLTCGLPKGAFEGEGASEWIKFNHEDWIPPLLPPKGTAQGPPTKGGEAAEGRRRKEGRRSRDGRGAQERGKPEGGAREPDARHRGGGASWGGQGSGASWEGKKGKASGPGIGHRSGASGETGKKREASSVTSASDLLFDYGDY